MLVATDAQIEDLIRKLMRIGLDNMLGYTDDVTTLDTELQTSDIIDLDTFKTYLNRNNVQVVDLRGATEYSAEHVEGAENVFIGTLDRNLDKISRDRPVVIYCQGGVRATIGYSILARNGFTNVKNFSGSMNEWVAQGNTVAAAETELVTT